jgi:hypothetical protein
MSCKNESKQENRITEIHHTREAKLKRIFINKKINVLNDILLIPCNYSETKIVFLYTGYDCQSCIDKGYEIMKKIDSLLKNKIFIVASHSNIGMDQERNNYMDSVYNDDNELIRKELKFLPTPIIFILNEENYIVNLVFPETNSNTQNIVKGIIRNIQ